MVKLTRIIQEGRIYRCSTTLRKSILAQIHEGHLGMERSKLRARKLVFWPGMSKQIEDVVSNCTTCQQLRLSNPKEPMIPHEIRQYPWQIVASDLFEWNGSSYVLVVDYYRRYWEIAVLHSTTSTAVINKLREIFARHGIPETVKSDNGPQYSSAVFDTFAANWKFSHVTSSPKYPQSNGLAEKTVQTAKRMLEKAKRDRRDPYLALLEQRNTPVASYKSPAQLSMGRCLRSLLPCTTNHLIPQTVCYHETQSMFQKKQAEQKSNYDKSAVPLQPLKTGEAVRVKQECEWRPGKVIEIADTPRSYLVETPEGAVYRRLRFAYRRVA
ncbi:sec1 family domain-containing 2 [Paramuricea clavata]|uniref:Sec1 family domain-containing 2 n=1 Tax=Paramuricea clavata TaxID=317549 RepID=A0A6S7KGD3_PARCT|nr:sec1 family domain-containing 2 [Paramuricea clavata]